MHCKPSLQRNKEFFCNFVSFFQGDTQKAQRGQQNAQTGSGETGDTGGGRSADRTEQEKIAEPAQEHAQEHEQAQLAPAGDAAQEEEQHRGQQTVGRVEDGEQLFPPGPAQHGSQKIVKKAQRQAAAQAQQGLQGLTAGIDAHQPSSLPRKPRLRSCSPA